MGISYWRGMHATTVTGLFDICLIHNSLFFMCRHSFDHCKGVEMACTHSRQPAVFPVSRIAVGFSDHPSNDRIIFRLGLGRIPFSSLHPAGMDACQGPKNRKRATLFRRNRGDCGKSWLSFLCSNGRYSYCTGRMIMKENELPEFHS